MAVLSVSEARARWADVVDQARRTQEPVFLTRRGRRVVAVVDADVLDRLVELVEDAVDARAAEQARAEMRRTGERPVL